jgi:Ca2+-binding RTX toxin-like protein
MRRIRARRAILALMVVQMSVVWSIAASNVIPQTRIDDDKRTIGVNDLKPSSCSAITVTNKVTGSGTINGTNASDLILGGSAVDSISGANSADCLLGGDGNDSLNGGNGTDVCIGGPGTDTFASCETQIQ